MAAGCSNEVCFLADQDEVSLLQVITTVKHGISSSETMPPRSAKAVQQEPDKSPVKHTASQVNTAAVEDWQRLHMAAGASVALAVRNEYTADSTAKEKQKVAMNAADSGDINLAAQAIREEANAYKESVYAMKAALDSAAAAEAAALVAGKATVPNSRAEEAEAQVEGYPSIEKMRAAVRLSDERSGTTDKAWNNIHAVAKAAEADTLHKSGVAQRATAMYDRILGGGGDAAATLKAAHAELDAYKVLSSSMKSALEKAMSAERAALVADKGEERTNATVQKLPLSAEVHVDKERTQERSKACWIRGLGLHVILLIASSFIV